MKSSCPFIGDWFKGYYQYLFVLAYPVWIYYLLFCLFVILILCYLFYYLFYVSADGGLDGDGCVEKVVGVTDGW